MGRNLTLILVFVWLCFLGQERAVVEPDWQTVGVYLLLPFVMALGIALRGRRILRLTSSTWPTKQIRGFQRLCSLAHLFVAVWFGVGLFWLDWGAAVERIFLPLHDWPTGSIATVVAIAPPLLGWVALWWAGYGIERLLREQTVLTQFDANLPLTGVPRTATYLLDAFRSQILFLLAPVLAALFIHDLVELTFKLAHVSTGVLSQSVSFVCSFVFVYVLSPELLRRVLSTASLPDSPLRERLEAMCERLRLRHRDILIWHTSYGMGNAAVMGIVPRFRYVMLTDLLIESLTAEQLEAVFAHEAGHIKRRHMAWLAAFVAVVIALLAGPGDSLVRWIDPMLARLHMPGDLVVTLVAGAGVLIAFSQLSRLFERQADAYAAAASGPSTVILPGHDDMSITHEGAELFTSALKRVATINNVPLRRGVTSRGGLAGFVTYLIDLGRNFRHPSFESRIEHVHALADAPRNQQRFERTILLTKLTIIATLTLGVGWSVAREVRAGHDRTTTERQPSLRDAAG